MQLKKCKLCSVPKPIDQFRRNEDGSFKYHSCRDCQSKRQWQYYKRNPIKVMIISAKHRAKRDNVPFALAEKDIVIPDVCPILGIKLHAGDRRNHDYAPTVDKIDPALGYVPGNIVVISHRANRIKSDATIDELAKIVHFYAVTNLQVRRTARSTSSQSAPQVSPTQNGGVNFVSPSLSVV
jgi:hypothetical protein